MDNPTTSEESLKAAFAALLNDDIAERDRLCKRAEILLEAEARSKAIALILSTDYLVDKTGKVYISREVFEANN